MLTALVTGAAGFIGSRLTEALVSNNYRVVAIDNLSFGSKRIEHLLNGGQVVLEEGDIRDEHLMARVLSSVTFDAVYHLAALHYIPYCDAHRAETLSVNLVGTQVLLDGLRASPPRRFVFASTGDVYAPSDRAHDEGDPLEPGSFYGSSKLFAERLVCLAARQTSQCNFVIARLFNAYGSHETNPHVIPHIVSEVRTGSPLHLGSLWPRRDYIEVRDIARALLALASCSLESTVETFNIGTGLTYSVEDVVRLLEAILTRQLPITIDPARVRPVERPNLQAGIAKLLEKRVWQPRFSLREGLVELCLQEGLIMAQQRS